MSILNTLLPAENIFSSQTEREENSSKLGVCKREKVVEGLWVCEGQCREGMDAEVRMCVAGSKAVPPDWRGSVSKSKGRDLCACKEKGDYKCVCVSTCTRGWGFPPSSFHMHPS